MTEKENEKINICIYKKIIKRIIELPSSLDALEILREFKIKTDTHLSNLVQSDNEDFVCALRSLFAISTCQPISKCVCFSLSPLLRTLFSNDLFDESR
jgi:hypothetical protein